jgi:hypothetical protein
MKLRSKWFGNLSLKEQKMGLKEQKGGIILSCKKLCALQVSISNDLKGVSKGFTTLFLFYNKKLRYGSPL